jgi:hypothetical protein
MDDETFYLSHGRQDTSKIGICKLFAHNLFDLQSMCFRLLFGLDRIFID